MDYNAINFKNKDVDKLSKKFNPPVPAYAQGKSTNFAGYDRKRESVIPETKGTGKAVSTVRGAGNVTPNKVEKKSRLERQMEKYGVEPVTNSKYSPREQRERNRTRLNLAKDKERAAKPTPVRDKIGDKVDRVLGKGKYDRGSMGKNMSLGGNRSKVNVDRAGQKQQDADCKAKRGKSKACAPKTGGNYQWTITK